MPPINLRYVDVQRDRHGRPLYYFRHQGRRQRIPGNPGEHGFAARYAELLAQVQGGTAPKPSAPKAGTLHAVIAGYRASPEFARLAPDTQRNYAVNLDRLGCIGRHDVTAITRPDLLMIRDRLASERGPRTADLWLAVVRRLFSWALDREHVSRNPLSRVARVAVSESYAPWSEAECAAFEASNPPRWALTAYMLARYAAVRRGDVIRLTRANYDGTDLTFTPSKTHRSKSGGSLVIPVHSRLKAHLDTLPLDVGLLVPSRSGRAWKPEAFSHALRTALDAAGLAHLDFHGLRHTAATHLAELGVSTHRIAAVTGHKSLSMVQTYTQRAEQKRLAAEAISQQEEAEQSARRRRT